MHDEGNCIYIASHPREEGWKIGKANNIMNRLSEYNTGTSLDYKLDYIEYINNMGLAEKMIQHSLRKYRMVSNKEWYKPRILQTIIDCIQDTKNFLNKKY